LSGGEHSFAAQANLQIDAEIAENSRFRTETKYYHAVMVQTSPTFSGGITQYFRAQKER
jgi:hypothetical protein